MAAEDAFLTVAQVAGELDMTPDGVYKLIRRGKLKAARRSERKTYVSHAALAAYRRRLNGEGPDTRRPAADFSPAELRVEFELEAGRTPEQWIADWKADAIEDTIDNVRLTVRALALHSSPDDDAATQGAAPDWAVAAFANRSSDRLTARGRAPSAARRGPR